MAEPDELYTLRAQFWLGHYSMALDEAKSIQRRPMSPQLKEEREILVQRATLAMGDAASVISSNESPAIQALYFQAQYELATDDATKDSFLQQLQALASGESANASVQLTAAHVNLKAGKKKEALQCIHTTTSRSGSSPPLEHLACLMQIYLQLDRLDLAKTTLTQLKRKDEDSILVQLCGVYIALATGASMAKEAIHSLTQLSEQYGPSVLLLNLGACASLQAGQYAQAESKCDQARQELGAGDTDANTLVNLLVAYQYQQQSDKANALLQTIRANHPTHFLVQGLTMVEGAYERESLRYRVAS